jgi:xanthine dehydrogenase large subunit
MNTIAESSLNVKGLTKYLDDLPDPEGGLQAAVKLSESAHGEITRIDATEALALDPSVRVITAADIPGENQIGSNKSDEPVLPEREWEYWGQPLVLVLASKRSLARKAASIVKVEGKNLPSTIDPRVAAKASDFILPSRTIRYGDPEKAFSACDFVVSGRVDSGGQEHVYLETQGCYAEVRDGGKMFVISGTQGPTGVQLAISKVLGLPMNMVEVEARRLGGAFGGKEDQAATWASLAAIGAWVSGKPVKLYLNRKEDMRATGKRHPYSTDFRIGADKEGNLLAFEADYYQNSGSTCDLSPAIMARTILHATGAYHVPNVRVTGYMCKTNLPSFTAFRGFGAPQAFFVIESAMDALALEMKTDQIELRRKNLYSEGDSTYFGMPLERVRAAESFDRLLVKAKWQNLRKSIDSFNNENTMAKKGAAVIPVCFGISFTKLPMNKAGALVHVYQDGSVLVSTGAIEMGQQVSRKIAVIVATTLGVDIDSVRVERTTTLTVANTVPTAASTGADLNGMAAKIACEEIRTRLARKAASMLADGQPGILEAEISFRDEKVLYHGEPTYLDWKTLVAAADTARIDLSAHGFYATPGLFYDNKSERGSPFAYYVYGAALVVARVDIVHATYSIEKAIIVHDAGKSLDRNVDIGQVEGAFAQGLGWSLLEDLRFGDDGRPLSDTLSTYKLPDIHFLPESVDVEFLPEIDNPTTPYNSKAVGEPPLQYGIAGYFAVLEAMRAANPDGKGFYDLPLIPEKIEAFLRRSTL